MLYTLRLSTVHVMMSTDLAPITVIFIGRVALILRCSYLGVQKHVFGANNS